MHVLSFVLSCQYTTKKTFESCRLNGRQQLTLTSRRANFSISGVVIGIVHGTLGVLLSSVLDRL